MPRPHVLLTGTNGFIASHIFDHLIKADYIITATARTQGKADAIIAAHSDWKDKVTSVLVPDFSAPAPFDPVIKMPPALSTTSSMWRRGCPSRPQTYSPNTREIFESAARFGGDTLKRLVLLGSAVSTINPFEAMNKEGKAYTEKDWNPITKEQALEKNDLLLGYHASTKMAETDAWAFMEARKPAWDLVVTNPVLITGPIIHPVSGPGSVNATTGYMIAGFINGRYPTVEEVAYALFHSESPTALQFTYPEGHIGDRCFFALVDVRDVARAHVEALTNPAAANQRLLLVSGLITPQLVVNAIRKHFPELRGRVPEGTPTRVQAPGVHPTRYDDCITRGILAKGNGRKWEYMDLETSVAGTVQSLLDHGVI